MPSACLRNNRKKPVVLREPLGGRTSSLILASPGHPIALLRPLGGATGRSGIVAERPTTGSAHTENPKGYETMIASSSHRAAPRWTAAIRNSGIRFLLIALVSIGAMPELHAAQVGLRLPVGPDRNGAGQYVQDPQGYPVNKEGSTFVCFDGYLKHPLPVTDRYFNTRNVILEMGLYRPQLKAGDGCYTGKEVVAGIRAFEKAGWNVIGVFLYREDWLKQVSPTGPHGDFVSVDPRLLGPQEVAAIRREIKKATPRLKCCDTVKLIQLLNGGTKENPDQTTWTRAQACPAVMKVLLSLDGVGVECHIGDEKDGSKTTHYRRNVLVEMAQIARWAKEHDKVALVFMGGMPPTYRDFPAMRQTYQYLWAQMAKVGVDGKANFIIYLRQGARPGAEVPETSNTTLLYQQKWLIESLGNDRPPSAHSGWPPSNQPVEHD